MKKEIMLRVNTVTDHTKYWIVNELLEGGVWIGETNEPCLRYNSDRKEFFRELKKYISKLKKDGLKVTVINDFVDNRCLGCHNRDDGLPSNSTKEIGVEKNIRSWVEDTGSDYRNIATI